jgi:hypothetical protein
VQNTSKARPFTARDKAYHRQRYKNRMFAEIARLFAEEAEHNQITKRDLAEWLERDPAQITRWLSTPSNLTLETISDILLALGAEEDPTIRRFLEKSIANYMHPLVERAINAAQSSKLELQGETSSSNLKIVGEATRQPRTIARPSPFDDVTITSTG